MRYRKAFLLLLSIFLYISSSAALSCAVPPPQYTFHCPEEGSCNSEFTVEELSYSESGEKISVDQYDSNLTTVNLSADTEYGLRTERLMVRKVRNTDLPSAEQALDDDKGLCPPAEDLHIYPKESLSEQELEDTTICYRTQIEERENYFAVDRLGTTEPLRCHRVTKETMISGGGKSWVEPYGPLDIILRIIWIPWLV